MSLLDFIKQIWENFVSHFKHKSPDHNLFPFQRIIQAGNWRTRQGLWAGTLVIFPTSRIYFLEVGSVYYGEKKRLNLPQGTTHSFRLSYLQYSQYPKEINLNSISSVNLLDPSSLRSRVVVFYVHINCNILMASADYTAIEILGNKLATHINDLCSQSRPYLDLENMQQNSVIRVVTVKKKGHLSLVKIVPDSNTGENELTVFGVLSRMTPGSNEYWQNVLNRKFDEYKERLKTEDKKKRGF